MDCIDPQVRGRRKGYFLFQQEEKNVGLSSVGAGCRRTPNTENEVEVAFISTKKRNWPLELQ